MAGKKSGKSQRKMTEFLTKPEPISVAKYLCAHPYREGFQYLKALRKACQLNQTLDQVEILVKEARQELLSRPYDDLDLHVKIDRQERIYKLANGQTWPQMFANLPPEEQSRLLDATMERLLQNATDVSKIDLEWYIKTQLPIPTTRRYSQPPIFVEQHGDGGVKPLEFAILICDDSDELIHAARILVYGVKECGGNAAIKLSPDGSAGVVNVVVGGYSPKWSTCNVKLYSSDLLFDAMDNEEFKFENTTQYEV